VGRVDVDTEVNLLGHARRGQIRIDEASSRVSRSKLVCDFDNRALNTYQGMKFTMCSNFGRPAGLKASRRTSL
jgi:hypothetical protein